MKATNMENIQENNQGSYSISVFSFNELKITLLFLFYREGK